MSQDKPPINWKTTLFLLATFLISVIGVPWFISRYGFHAFDLVHFLVMAYATGLAITVGYHRLFAHRSFQARKAVRVITGLFAAATFENSILTWASEHRYHHKYVDRDGFPYDPYNINKGFFHAHMGWLLREQSPKMDRSNVADLEKDPFVRWQDRHIHALMISMGLLLPILVGVIQGLLSGRPLFQAALAGFLFGGVARVVFVHHGTFFINSLCHFLGRRPYDSGTTARDSGLVAFFTYGEGYHNYHHTFPGDYRNGIRAWHFDPGKWVIWLLEKTRLAWSLKRVPEETVQMARLREQRRRLEHSLTTRLEDLRSQASEMLLGLEQRLELLHARARQLWSEHHALRRQPRVEHRPRLQELKREARQLRLEFMAELANWQQAAAALRATA